MASLALACQRLQTPRTLSKEELSQLSSTIGPSFEIAQGFDIELFAAEPLVKDPVAMEIDEQGRLYVVEMPGYPLDISGSGKIVQLIDSDQDGYPDERHVFAEGLVLPTGIMRWKQGFLVTDAPDVLYLEDSDDDGRADIREVLLTGFARSNPQHNVNSPVYGLDNMIYLANEYYISTEQHADILGDKGSPILFPNAPGSPQLPPNGDDRSVRFHPDKHLLENTSSQSQYGHTFDPWGRYFQTSNASHLHHEVIASTYLLRKPHLLVADAQQYVPSYGHPIEVFPITRQPNYQLLTDIGTITSACAVHWYKGSSFPDSFQQVVFTAEPTHNLIHADKMHPYGASFTSTPLIPEGEFVRSTDPWFRPVFLYQGPDEALYIVDYHRKIIEHPEWMAAAVNESGELYDGSQKGRIFRLIPTSSERSNPTPFPNLQQASSAQLVDYLFHPNSWFRQTAQRLLLDRKDAEGVSLIHQQMEKEAEGPGQVHALWTLQGLEGLTVDRLRKAWNAKEAGIRENAIKLLEFFPDSLPSLLPEVAPLRNDPNDRVRFQWVCTLGQIPEAQDMLWECAFDNLADPWINLAVFTSPSLEEGELFRYALSQLSGVSDVDHRAFFETLGASWAAQPEPQGLSYALEVAFSHAASDWKAPFLKGIYQAVKHKNSGIDHLTPYFDQFLATALNPLPELRSISRDIVGLFPPASEDRLRPTLYKAEAIIGDQKQAEALRADAIELLATLFPERYDETFFAYLKSTAPAPLQQAAVKGLGKLPDNQGCQHLLAQWAAITPPIRDLSVDQFMSSKSRMEMLLKAVEDSVVQASTIGWPRTVQLMNHDDSKLKEYARQVLAPEEEMDEEMLDSYVSALPKGSPSSGHSIYQQQCQSCHTYKGKGPISYGPDLATLRNRAPGSLLRDILYPSRAIADGYEIWNCTLQNGQEMAGIIAHESSNSLTLRMADGSEHILPRSELKRLQALPYSGMPTGLHTQIPPKDMADLISFIKWGNTLAANEF